MSFVAVEKFEQKIADFYGSKYAVAVDCCTHAIELCLRYTEADNVTFPTRTYISVPFLGEKLKLNWSWDDRKWQDYYYIGNTNIVDAAVLWKKDAYIPGTFMCLSFQFQKHLSLGRGGMILTDDATAAEQLKKMSYDGRLPDKPWRQQNIDTMGYHYYMTPETAERGLFAFWDALEKTPRKWVWEDWPDLRNMDIFKAQG